MKRRKLTLVQCMLATVVGVSALVGANAVNKNVAAADSAETYALNDVFSSKDATIGVDAENKTSFTFSSEGSVTLKRNLAYTWLEGKNDAKYLTLKFALKDANFEKVNFSFDATSAWATEEDKATNVLSIKKESDGNFVYINDEKTTATVTVGQTVTFALSAGDEDGEFAVLLNGTEIGSFVNVGANYAEYSYNETYPLTIEAQLPANAADDATTVVTLSEINGQTFENITEGKVTDNAAPVVVVNEAVDGFLLGTAFSLDYTVIDVLKSKNLTKTLEYYQYNPNYAEGDENYEKYKALDTSVWFYETTFTPEGEGKTTVYEKYGYECVSVKMTVADSTFNADEGEFKKKTYDLSWYVNSDAVVSAPNGKTDYIKLQYNTEAPTYKHIQLNEQNATNEYKDETSFNAKKDAYQEKLNALAQDVYAGSNSYIYFPSMEWLFADNNGYRGLKFTISYKTPKSDSPSTSSSLAYNALKLSVANEGAYEFKVFAVDKAGNKMKYYVDGELTELNATNVWDIEQIPSFTFKVANRNLKVEDPSKASSRKDSEILNKSYSFDSFTVIGASDLQEKYALYKIDYSKYNATAADNKRLTQSALTAVTYETLAKAVQNRWSEVQNGDYFAFYIKVYSELLAKEIGAESTAATSIASCFERIGEKGDNINNATDKYEKYEWNADSQSFKTVEEGEYLMLADLWEKEIPQQRATAYKLVVVESKEDVIEGENNWLKNNLASVILFAVAGVMLILIIILALIKPSDETLEDIDQKVKKSAKKEDKDEE